MKVWLWMLIYLSNSSPSLMGWIKKIKKHHKTTGKEQTNSVEKRKHRKLNKNIKSLCQNFTFVSYAFFVTSSSQWCRMHTSIYHTISSSMQSSSSVQHAGGQTKLHKSGSPGRRSPSHGLHYKGNLSAISHICKGCWSKNKELCIKKAPCFQISRIAIRRRNMWLPGAKSRLGRL